MLELPGESQKIDRITEAFAKSYFGQQASSEFHTWDGVHILTFSIIMLNTDLHSPQVKKRMSLEEFVRNNRGINQDKARNIFYINIFIFRVPPPPAPACLASLPLNLF